LVEDEERQRPRMRHLDANYDRAKRSNRHEKRLAERLGGRRLPRSGGLARSKWGDSSRTANGDIGTADFHLEHKRTVKDSMSVKREWLAKVSEGARRVLKEPGLVICFENRVGEPEEWVAVPLAVFERLLAAVDSKDE
jgi:hypothetical protein